MDFRHVLSLLLAAIALTPHAAAQATTLESATSEGLWGEQYGSAANSDALDLSGDGRFVLFRSYADNLVNDDLGYQADIFVRDRQSGWVERMSVSTSGEGANSFSIYASISDDGRFVAFDSSGTNLVPGDVNLVRDVFLRDRQLSTTACVSVNSSGLPASGWSDDPRVSGDGRFVVFRSGATDLVPQNANPYADIFLFDRVTGTCERASVSSTGEEADFESYDPDLSLDGRFVCFFSPATNLGSGESDVDQDVFLRDRLQGTTVLVSRNLAGTGGNDFSNNPRLSADGCFVAFQSEADDLVAGDFNQSRDVFVYDVQAMTVELGSVAQNTLFPFDDSHMADLSADGRWLLFTSNATNVVMPDNNGYADAYLRDRVLGLNYRASTSWDGTQSDGGFASAVSDDGRIATFASLGKDLVPLNQPLVSILDVYAHDFASTLTPMQTYCTPKPTSQGCVPLIGATGAPTATGNDAFFVFTQFVIPAKNGVFFWGASPASLPFGGGTLCVQPPTVRSLVLFSGNGPSCGGAFSFHFSHAYMAHKSVDTGDVVYGQVWSRDPGYAPPNNFNLSNGIQIEFGP